MDKWIFLLVVFILAIIVVAVFGAVSDAPNQFVAEQAAIKREEMYLEATIAAATPTTIETLNENRYGLYEYDKESKSGDSSLLWIALMIVAIAGAGALFVSSEGSLKQLRLMVKGLTSDGGGRTRQPIGRTRTVPQIPAMTQQYLPQSTEQMPQEVEWYED